jgi:molecular chaperone GrpE
LSDPSIRHDRDEPAADRASSAGYVPLGDITLLSSAPLSSELNLSDAEASDSGAPEVSGSEVSASEMSVSEGDPTGEAERAAVEPAVEPESSVEALLDDLERVTKERDGYLDDTRRLAAEFANFRRQNDKRQIDVIEQAAASLVERLLPVLDACDGALAHGATDVEPIYNMLVTTLEKAGLAVMRPLGEAFDPNQHDAVIHEPGDGDGPHVAEVLRTGYLWNGRVVRPALVKVRD